jgi:UDP-N-acetylmuramoyl-tripeptide--D-alanyl-D-alanine ligase
MAERDEADANLPCAVVAVENTRRALGAFAAEYRKDFSLPIVAVGGSNGKTTTKELIASVLRRKYATLWSEASFNNDIGVPLTLLRLEKNHAAAVLELGTNHPGELAPLSRLLDELEGKLLEAAKSLDAGKGVDGEAAFKRLRQRAKARRENA